MGQLGELAKKTEKPTTEKTYTIVGDKTDAQRARELKIQKERERVQSIQDARAKSEAAMKGLEKSAARK